MSARMVFLGTIHAAGLAAPRSLVWTRETEHSRRTRRVSRSYAPKGTATSVTGEERISLSAASERDTCPASSSCDSPVQGTCAAPCEPTVMPSSLRATISGAERKPSAPMRSVEMKNDARQAGALQDRSRQGQRGYVAVVESQPDGMARTADEIENRLELIRRQPIGKFFRGRIRIGRADTVEGEINLSGSHFLSSALVARSLQSCRAIGDPAIRVLPIWFAARPSSAFRLRICAPGHRSCRRAGSDRSCPV